MRILIAPDKFKGSLSALEAARAIKKGISQTWPSAEIIEMPVADGGEGTAEAIHGAKGGEWIGIDALDPLGRQIAARYLWLGQTSTAVIEMSEVSGLWRLAKSERNPVAASTFGTGQLILDAIEHGAAQIIVGLGGSATNDGGIGMAAALGYRFLTSDGELIEPVPSNLLALTSIRQGELPAMPEIVAACDVGNPLLGGAGATRVFGPQKGADAKSVEFLEQGLENLADVAAHDLGCDFRNEQGAGAAGGMGFGLLTFCHAKIRPGFDVVAVCLDLESSVISADLVITGEGSLDAQTRGGKAPHGVAKLARKHGKRVIAYAGTVSTDVRWEEIFDEVHSISGGPVSREDSIRDAANLLEQSVLRTARLAAQ